MVNTRSQNVDSYAACSSGMEQNSDNESEYSFPNTLSRNQMNEFENGDLINVRQNSSSNSVDQRFMEMNKKISELTNIVLALTEKISTPTTECSGLNTVINTNVTRSANLYLRIFCFSAAIIQISPNFIFSALISYGKGKYLNRTFFLQNFPSTIFILTFMVLPIEFNSHKLSFK